MNLIEPGTKFLDRWNQLDIKLTRNFELRKVRFDVGVDLFNALNENAPIIRNQNFGVSLDQPQQILQPIMARLALKLNF